MLYQKNGSGRINTYLNIESRQTTNRSAFYGPNEHAYVKWHDLYLEMGKNRETQTSVTLIWHDLGMIRQQEPTKEEVLELLKTATLGKYIKKHTD